ncbi:hypothetical protein [Geminicoccus harenae]|uniref:hypothetical protein n=1 Tax=Geminicoccus harenae TaxID=2498453 RepID=UPI00168B9023|nr:hypothetical protein [Geminicoccus harenae]
MLRSALLAALLLATPAMAEEAAEPICQPVQEVLRVTSKIGQFIRSEGETDIGAKPVILTLNPDTGAWSVWVLMTPELACLFAEN